MLSSFLWSNKDSHNAFYHTSARLKFKTRQPPLLQFPSFLFPPFHPFPFTSFPLPFYRVEGPGKAEVWSEAPAAECFGTYLSQKEWLWWQNCYGFWIKISSVFWSEWVRIAFSCLRHCTSDYWCVYWYNFFRPTVFPMLALCGKLRNILSNFFNIR